MKGDSQIGKKIEMTKDNIDAGGKKQLSRIDEILKDIKAITGPISGGPSANVSVSAMSQLQDPTMLGREQMGY